MSLERVQVQLYSIFDLGTRRGWGVSVMPRPHLTPGKDPVSIVQEVEWASKPVWTGVENLAPTGIRSPDRPARRQSLYWLRYPAHRLFLNRYTSRYEQCGQCTCNGMLIPSRLPSEFDTILFKESAFRVNECHRVSKTCPLHAGWLRQECRHSRCLIIIAIPRQQ
jgi:hypothetical protein